MIDKYVLVFCTKNCNVNKILRTLQGMVIKFAVFPPLEPVIENIRQPKHSSIQEVIEQ